MCGESGSFEQFFPLVRAINQKLPTTKRLRVLAADPPIDNRKLTKPFLLLYNALLKGPLDTESV